MDKPCFFCDVQKQSDSQAIAARDTCFARYDDFPVSKGHAEIVPKRHIASFFELSGEEFADIHALLTEVEKDIDSRYSPDGYTVGVNIGEAGGQTIPHVHLHVIPRYKGDTANPKGGIRNILRSGDYSDAAKAAGKEKYL